MNGIATQSQGGEDSESVARSQIHIAAGPSES